MLVRQWRYVPWVVGAVVVLGVLTVKIVGDLWPRSVARAPLAADGPFGGLVDNWVLPGAARSASRVRRARAGRARADAGSHLGADRRRRAAHLGVFVWENKLIFQPSVTRFLLVGALLVFVMNLRPQGLIGTARTWRSP